MFQPSADNNRFVQLVSLGKAGRNICGLMAGVWKVTK